MFFNEQDYLYILIGLNKYKQEIDEEMKQCENNIVYYQSQYAKANNDADWTEFNDCITDEISSLEEYKIDRYIINDIINKIKFKQYSIKK